MRMYIKWLFAIRACLGLTTSTIVFANVEMGVVKIFSHSCQNDLSSFKGSGLLYVDGDDVFILTSEHVVLHGNQDLCHEVQDIHFVKHHAELVQADWGYGLALLRLIGGLDEVRQLDLIYKRDLFSATNLLETKVTTFGYPHRTDQLIRTMDSHILIARSQRAFIPLVQELVEIAGGHVEFGMSGGPTFTWDENGNAKLVGILSHQAIKLVAGLPAEVADISDTLAVADDYFVIPAAAIQSWLARVRQGFKPSFLRDPIDQVQSGTDVVYTDGLKFELFHGSLPPSIGGADGTGAGGADGTGAGGADGTGAGGHNDTAKKAAYIRVSEDLERHPANWNFAAKQAWIEKIRAKAIRHIDVNIPFLMRYDQKHRSGQAVRFQSLSHFFSLLNSSNLSPVAYVESLESDLNHGVLIQNIGNAAMEILVLIERLKSHKELKQSLDADRLFLQLNLLSELLTAKSWQTIDRLWLIELAKVSSDSSFAAGWRLSFNTDFEASVALMSLINSLKERLDQIRISEH